MIVGQTVFYRLTYGQAAAVNKRRADAENFRKMMAGLTDFQVGIDIVDIFKEFLESGFVVHYGDPVKGGELLPAEVVRSYSALEKTHIDPDFGGPSQDLRKIFSGIADLRVHLPGNDVLWMPCAHIDMECEAHTGKGVGITMLPKHGKFTTVSPAELLH